LANAPLVSTSRAIARAMTNHRAGTNQMTSRAAAGRGPLVRRPTDVRGSGNRDRRLSSKDPICSSSVAPAPRPDTARANPRLLSSGDRRPPELPDARLRDSPDSHARSRLQTSFEDALARSQPSRLGPDGCISLSRFAVALGSTKRLAGFSIVERVRGSHLLIGRCHRLGRNNVRRQRKFSARLTSL
jgi:hypothetical protein